jgi:hypothetical protein
LPSNTGRKIRVARNAEKRQWLLAIGPDISRAGLIEKEATARAAAPVQQLQQTHDDLLTRAAALEAEAKAVREQARTVDQKITETVIDRIGPANPFTETFTFQSNKATDRELAALPQDQLVERLLATTEGAIDHGFWGGMTLLARINACRVGGGSGWTKIGSPDWLGELFPDWNEQPKRRSGRKVAEREP